MSSTAIGKRHKDISFSVIATVNRLSFRVLHVYCGVLYRGEPNEKDVTSHLSAWARPSASAERSGLPATSVSLRHSRFPYLYLFRLPPHSVRTLPLIHTDRRRCQEDLGQRSLGFCSRELGSDAVAECRADVAKTKPCACRSVFYLP